MSKLYELKRGGVGTFEEAWKENFVDMMKFLTLEEMVLLSSQLRNIRQVYSNDNQRLQEAEATIKELERALDIVADIVYSKLFSNSEDLELAADEIVERFRKKAIDRGYKEQD